MRTLKLIVAVIAAAILIPPVRQRQGQDCRYGDDDDRAQAKAQAG